MPDRVANEPVRPRIMDFLTRQDGFVHVGGFARSAQVSAPSVRMVLRELEQAGRLETCPAGDMPGWAGAGYRPRPGDSARELRLPWPGRAAPLCANGETDGWLGRCPRDPGGDLPGREISSILALPEEPARGELAARGLYPVSVAHTATKPSS